jgi:CRP/FNR family transcriptional regulator, cyclic AMP receptor protein
MNDVLELFRDDPDRLFPVAGDFIFREGDEARDMVVVLEGEIEVLVGNLRVEVAGPGSVLGEMALIEPFPRAATARAVTNAKLARVNRDRFEVLIQKSPPFATHVMRIMAERLRRMNRLLVDGV